MSRYIQIPNRINQIKSKARLNMIYCYALIRSQIKDNTYTAAYPEEQLAAQLGVDERTIGNYIRFFKEQSDLFKSVTKKQGEAEYKYNVYQLDYLTSDYFTIDPAIIDIPDLSAAMKGLLMLIKTYCINGTNYLTFQTQTSLAQMLHVSKNNINKYLKELSSKGYIKIINKTLHLSLNYFQLSTKKTPQNSLYEIIYKYCLEQDVTPPYKDTDTNDLGTIAATFTTPEILLKALRERCPKLPQTVSMKYFTEILVHKKVETRTGTPTIITD